MAMVFVSQPVSAESEVSTMEAMLPDPRYEGAAVWDGRDLPTIGCAGGCAYLVGGRDGTGQAYGDILAYNPTADRVWVAAELPEPMKLSSVIFSGDGVYILGGSGGSGALSTVLHFDPVWATVVDAGVSLPHPVAAASAVWDATVTHDCPAGCAYLFGGANNESEGGGYRELDQILRIDPAHGTTQVVGTMPTVRSSTSAAWDPDARVAYVLGGRYLDGPTVFLDEILAFDPSAGTTSLAGRLPEPLAYGAAVHDGERVLYFGGYPTHTGSTYHSDQIVAFNPPTGSTSVLDARLPTARVHAAAVAAGPAAYVLGGWNGFPGLRDIVRFGPEGHDVTLPTVDDVDAIIDHASRHVELVWSVLDGDEALEGFIIERDGTALATLRWEADQELRFIDEVASGSEHCYQVLATTADGTVPPDVPPACIVVDAERDGGGAEDRQEQDQQEQDAAEETSTAGEPVAVETPGSPDASDPDDGTVDAVFAGFDVQPLGSGAEARQVTQNAQVPLEEARTPTAPAWVTVLLLLGGASVLRRRR